jgi:hypothetical protein
MTGPKLQFNLDEENELSFKISIEGSSSDIGSTTPKMRFLVSEKETGKGWVFPTDRSDNGTVNVRIPPGEDVFLETKTYTGKLEVILGNHYFVPTEVDIEFKKPLKVEASMVKKKQTPVMREHQGYEDEEYGTQPHVQSSLVHRTARKRPAKRSWNDLTLEEQKKLKKLLMQKQNSSLRKVKVQEEKQKRQQAGQRKKQEHALKEQLKNLMSDSLLDD